MAIVWQSKEARRYRSIRKNHTGFSRNFLLKASYIFLHQLDLVSTVFAVSIGLSELNPVMRSLLTTPLLLVTIKLVIPLLIVWLIPSKLLIPAIVFLSLVVCWNVKELLLVLL